MWKLPLQVDAELPKPVTEQEMEPIYRWAQSAGTLHGQGQGGLSMGLASEGLACLASRLAVLKPL